MSSFIPKNTAYGAIRELDTSYESDVENVMKIDLKESPETSNNKKYVGAVISLIGLSLVLAAVVMSQTNGARGSSVNFVERNGVKAPITKTGSAPPPPQVAVEGMGGGADTIPVISKASIVSSRTFGLNRVGYSFIPTDNEPLTYTKFSKYTSVVEPHVDNTLWLAAPDATKYYKFSVCSTSTNACNEGVYSSATGYTNIPVNFACSPGDSFTLSYTSYSIATGEQVDSASGTSICMYVRREIRALTSADLAKTMDAMHTLWTTSEKEGNEKYGSEYHSASYFVNLHHFNAAWQDSDHIHEGNGFFLQHAKMTNMFENAMRSVDPSVTLPYWDYTVDNSVNRSPFNSFIMTPEVFGSMTHPSDITYGFGPKNDKIVDAAIPDGRWAFLKAEKTDQYPDLKHPFGYVRAPWNMNPSPYVSRFTYDYRIGINLPSCSSHYQLLQQTNMMNFFYDSAFDAHATTHSMIGGIYGCELMTPLLEQGYINSEEDMKQICAKWVFNLKEFYRFNFITPRTDCTVDSNDVNSATCGFSCPDLSSVFTSNIKARLGSHIPEDISDEGLDAWADFICNGDGYRIFAGDHLESASPADPSFWVIHPTLERVFQAKIMAGGFDESEWVDKPKVNFVCEKSRCYEASEGKVGYYADCCYGHFENDRLYNPVAGARAEKLGKTNAQMLADSDPSSENYALPYIYDTFAWTHCSQDFNSLVLDLKASVKSS